MSSVSDEHTVTIPASHPEVVVLEKVQSGLGSHPSVVNVAKGMSKFGDHSIGWVALAGIGAAIDKPRRRQWLAAGAGAFGAHAASVVVKRVVRRPRPDHPSVAVKVTTPGKLSFPSSHATSTTAAAVLMGRLTGLPLPALLVPPMLISRMVLGVHYPTDVLAGSAMGAVSAAVVLRSERFWSR